MTSYQTAVDENTTREHYQPFSDNNNNTTTTGEWDPEAMQQVCILLIWFNHTIGM